MISFLSRGGGTRAILAVTDGEISLASDNRLDPFRLHRVVERDRAVHVAVVGHGARVHAQSSQAFGKRFNLDGAVEQAVVGVKMKVNERFSLRHH